MESRVIRHFGYEGKRQGGEGFHSDGNLSVGPGSHAQDTKECHDELQLTNTGDSFLQKGLKCSPQTDHIDSERNQNRIMGYSMIVKGALQMPLWLSSCSHSFLYYAEKKKKIAKIEMMGKLEIHRY